jgi:hypothetical protein
MDQRLERLSAGTHFDGQGAVNAVRTADPARMRATACGTNDSLAVLDCHWEKYFSESFFLWILRASLERGRTVDSIRAAGPACFGAALAVARRDVALARCQSFVLARGCAAGLPDGSFSNQNPNFV